MGSRPFPEISCMLCSKPVNSQADLCADEKGKAIHEERYVNRLLAGHPVAEKTL
jgi:predicted nucleic acid-binding Zn ribbon protein